MSVKRAKNTEKGFTLIEIIVVLVILGIIAAVAVPSIAGYISKMKQEARDAMAMSIFKISQTAITDAYSSGNSDEVGYDGTVDADKIDPALSAKELKDNSSNLVYLRIDKSDEKKSDSRLYKLLEPYVADKASLEETVQVEYNVVTEKVLSVFYSDEDSSIGYGAGAVYNAYIRDKSTLKSGKMGYWAVNSTGSPGTAADMEAMNIKLVDYDGVIGTGEGTTQEGNEINGGKNYGILTAECVLPEPEPSAYDYKITLHPENGNDEVINVTTSSWKNMAGSLDEAINGNGIYTETKASGQTVLVIVLDTPYSSFSITKKYSDLESGSLQATMKATLSGTSEMVSSNTADVLFGGETADGDGEDYTINSVRHLNNIRYLNTYGNKFIQKQNFACRDWNDKILKFDPLCDISYSIPPYYGYMNGFMGTYEGIYDGKAYTIYDLTATDSSSGLFYKIGAFGTVDGVSLDYTDEYYTAYSDASDTDKEQYFISGTKYAGGIAGESYGTIENCTVKGRVRSTGSYGDAGGIVGKTSYSWWPVSPGIITRCMTAAMVTGEGDDSNIGGITGDHGGVEVSYCEAGTACGVSAGTSEPYSILGKPYFGANPESLSSRTCEYVPDSGTVKNDICLTAAASGASDCNTGGIVGQNSQWASGLGLNISYCVNASKVSGYCAGGLIGLFQTAHLKLQESYNAGTVEGSGYAGGLAGNFVTPTIASCYNTGDVTGTGTGYTGGLAGYMHGGADMSDSYNAGNIKENSSGYYGAVTAVWDTSGALSDVAYLKTTCSTPGQLNWGASLGSYVKAYNAASLGSHKFDGMEQTTSDPAGPYKYEYPHISLTSIDGGSCSLGDDFHRTPWK